VWICIKFTMFRGVYCHHPQGPSRQLPRIWTSCTLQMVKKAPPKHLQLRTNVNSMLSWEIWIFISIMNDRSSVDNIQKYETVRIHATTNEMALASVNRLAFLVETPMKAQNNYLK
jgi:hypothetical protein